METKAEDLGEQRDRALTVADESRRAQVRCEGSKAEVSAAARALRVTIADYEKTIAKLEDRPSGAFWFAVGFATPVLVALVAQVAQVVKAVAGSQ